MRLDLVSPYFRPVTGGIEDHVADVAGAAQVAGHDVTVHTLDRDLGGKRLAASGTAHGINVRRWPAGPRVGYYATAFHPQLDGDLAHLHGYGMRTHDWVARRSTARGMMMTLHHGLRIPTPTPMHALYHALHDRARGRGTLSRMAAIVCVNPDDAKLLRRWDIDRSRIHVIPNGVHEESFSDDGVEDPPPAWSAYVVYVGRLHAEKDVAHAVRAVAALPAHVGLLVAGPDHGQAARLRALAKQLGASKRVRFLGRVSEPRKRRLLAGAACLVLPSRFEAQGRVVLEAWAQGTPVVATRVGGVAHMVETGHDGHLVSYGDVRAMSRAIGRILRHAGRAGTMGRQGRAKARAEYFQPKLTKRLLALYEDVGSA